MKATVLLTWHLNETGVLDVSVLEPHSTWRSETRGHLLVDFAYTLRLLPVDIGPYLALYVLVLVCLLACCGIEMLNLKKDKTTWPILLETLSMRLLPSLSDQNCRCTCDKEGSLTTNLSFANWGLFRSPNKRANGISSPLFSNCHYTDQFDRRAFLCPTFSIVWFFPLECSKMSKCHSPQHHQLPNFPLTPLYHQSPSCRLTNIPRKPQFNTGADLSRNSFK